MILIIKALKKYISSKEVREEKKVIKQSLGKELKENRLRCKMTQEFVSETLGVSRQAVSKWELFSATAIKLIAVVFMFMDHIHQMFVTIGAPIWLTMVGRLIFPMFLFTAAESFYYTHNKRKYLQRLLFAS